MFGDDVVVTFEKEMEAADGKIRPSHVEVMDKV